MYPLSILKWQYPKSEIVFLQRFRSGSKDTMYLAALENYSQSWLDWCRRRWAGRQERLVPPFILFNNNTHTTANVHALGVYVSCTVCSWQLQLAIWPGRRVTLCPGQVQCMLGWLPWKGARQSFQNENCFSWATKSIMLNVFFRYGGADTGDRTMVTVFAFFLSFYIILYFSFLFSIIKFPTLPLFLFPSPVGCIVSCCGWAENVGFSATSWTHGCTSGGGSGTLLVSRCVSFQCDNICFLPLEGSHWGWVNTKSCSKGWTSQLHCSRAGHATWPRRRGHSSHL